MEPRPRAGRRIGVAFSVVLVSLLAVAGWVVFVGAPDSSRSSSSAYPSSDPRPTAAALIGGRPASEVAFVLFVGNVGENASVAAVDPASGDEIASYPTGHDPGAAASMAGDRLYVASGVDTASSLSVIDTETGHVLQQVRFPNRWMNTLPAYFPVMALSPDGRWLYALKVQSIAPEADIYSVAVFDTGRGEFLDAELALPGCIGGLLVPLDSRLAVACPHSGIFLSAPVSANGTFGPTSSTQASDFGFIGAARLDNSSDVVLLTKANKIVRVGSDGVSPVLAVVGEGAETPIFGAFAVSPDGSRAFVGLGDPSSERITTIQAYDLKAGGRTASARLPTDAWTMTLAADGTRLFAPSPGAQQVLVLETSQLQLVGKLPMKAPPVFVLGQ